MQQHHTRTGQMIYTNYALQNQPRQLYVDSFHNQPQSIQLHHQQQQQHRIQKEAFSQKINFPDFAERYIKYGGSEPLRDNNFCSMYEDFLLGKNIDDERYERLIEELKTKKRISYKRVNISKAFSNLNGRKPDQIARAKKFRSEISVLKIKELRNNKIMSRVTQKPQPIPPQSQPPQQPQPPPQLPVTIKQPQQNVPPPPPPLQQQQMNMQPQQLPVRVKQQQQQQQQQQPPQRMMMGPHIQPQPPQQIRNMPITQKQVIFMQNKPLQQQQQQPPQPNLVAQFNQSQQKTQISVAQVLGSRVAGQIPIESYAQIQDIYSSQYKGQPQMGAQQIPVLIKTQKAKNQQPQIFRNQPQQPQLPTIQPPPHQICANLPPQVILKSTPMSQKMGFSQLQPIAPNTKKN